MAKRNKDEQKTLESIKATPYMAKTIALVEDFVCKNNGDYLTVFDEVFRILNEAKPYVDKYLQERKSKGEIKDKYNIEYNPEKMPLVAFATVNFFDKINNPQTRGLLKFFDKSFIADNKDADFIARMSTLPNYINENLC